MDHGWADAYPGGGQPCHIVEGDFELYNEDSWIAMDTELGDITIFTYYGSQQPDGTRGRPRRVLEHSLSMIALMEPPMIALMAPFFSTD